ncbi:DUF748 domain-containing protein [Propionivibrio sp.]|uniref:DUF748 domain-containing protein n=1 Tax=Propionivibrio sp. TaxID=2212460 RepID=UPI0025DA1FB3|nr:DUF748 domain-containing protein [Propionivibrio sp.]MBK7355896.1 DUF748 domain-containing protein [Propionivibrio sp.]MBK8400443.1 DUF748 domain-containing protein [Propionivibrio sp.]MBK8746053.1 DUF748 domain-containing protein [Propionivibrio sp.]MBK8895304.1 DUF748 domain-containing protein [Propionivibrio sp.]MBL0206801.1 DUF748 domain-containing protein [Propionivibrio sp.]
MSTRARRWVLILGSTTLVLLIAGFAAFQFAVQSLKGQVEKALGPYGEIKEIRVGLTGLEIIGIRIRAPQVKSNPDVKNAWPAEDQLRAERILVVPAIRDLLSARVVLHTLRIEGAYVSMLRAKDGRIHVLPSLLGTATPPNEPGNTKKSGGKKEEAEASNTTPISIGKVELVNGAIEFFDATIRQPPLKLTLEQINASIGKIHLPDLKGQSPIKLDAVLKGVRHDGKISINGWIELASKEMEITTRLSGVDLVSLQPYLIKATESGVKKGTLDLDLASSVHKGLLHAPGTLTLSDMELASSSTTGTIMGMPRSAAIAMMKNRAGKISVKFVLDGNINDPHFSLNENLMTRIGSSVANTLGVSIEGLAKGVESIGSGSAKGIGDTLGKLFGK